MLEQIKQQQQSLLATANLEAIEHDLDSLVAIGVHLESIAQACDQTDGWNSPTARIAVEHTAKRLGLSYEDVGLEDMTDSIIDGIIKAIVKIFKRAYEAVLRWAGVIKDQLIDLYKRLQATIDQIKDNDPVDVEFKDTPHLIGLAVDGKVDLSVVVSRLQQITDILPLFKTSGEKIVYKFNTARRMGEVNKVTTLSDKLMDDILHHFSMVGKKHVHTSKQQFPGSRRLVADLTNPVMNFAILQDEGVDVEPVTLTIEDIEAAIVKLDIKNMVKKIDEIEDFSKQVDKTMRSGFTLNKGDRDVAKELLKLSAPINAMLQRPPRVLINYYTKSIAHLEALLDYALKQSSGSK